MNIILLSPHEPHRKDIQAASRVTLHPRSPRHRDPFVIIHHHRKAKKLKKMRELRRKKLQNKRERERRMAEAEKREAVTHINRSMLLEEDDWNNVKSLIVSEESQVSVDESLAFENKVKNLCWEVLYVIPVVPKRQLFEDNFEGFQYEC